MVTKQIFEKNYLTVKISAANVVWNPDVDHPSEPRFKMKSIENFP